eukprot:UN09149
MIGDECTQARHARDRLPDHKRHRAELGGHDPPVQLHLLRAAEDQPGRAQDHADRGGDEPPRRTASCST